MKVICNIFAALVDYFDLYSETRVPKLGDRFRK